MYRSLFFFVVFVVFFTACNNSDGSKGLIHKRHKIVLPKGDIGVPASTINHWKERLDRHFTRLHDFARFNGNVLIARKGNIIYANSFGIKDIVSKDSLNLESVFQIASLSKTFTGMATLLLVEDGKLRLDQTLEEFFEGFPYEGITVENLLTHRSGLPNYLNVTEKDWEGQGLKSNRDLLDYLIEKKPKMLGSVNKSFFYNNTNYALLALIIEQVSGIPFEDFMKKRIFDPLGMKHTYIYSYRNQDLPKKNLTKGYLHKGVEDKMVAPDGIVGDKNVYSTVGDLLKWERANAHPVLFQQATLDSSVVGRSHEKPGSKNYGYGWRMNEHAEAGKLIYHNGWWHGYTAAFSRNPADETVIIVLSNIFNRATYRIQPVWDILYGEGAISGEEPSE